MVSKETKATADLFAYTMKSRVVDCKKNKALRFVEPLIESYFLNLIRILKLSNTMICAGIPIRNSSHKLYSKNVK